MTHAVLEQVFIVTDTNECDVQAVGFRQSSVNIVVDNRVQLMTLPTGVE